MKMIFLSLQVRFQACGAAAPSLWSSGDDPDQCSRVPIQVSPLVLVPLLWLVVVFIGYFSIYILYYIYIYNGVLQVDVPRLLQPVPSVAEEVRHDGRQEAGV